MNQTYAIRGTTLTALGDVVRSKVGETKFVSVMSDTVNVEWVSPYGIDKPTSSMLSISSTTAAPCTIERTIFGLYKVKINISKIESNGQFRFLVYDSTNHNVCDNYYNNNNGPIDLEFEDFDGYVKTHLIAMGGTTWVKFTYTVEYYDMDDNPVGYQQEVKNTMTVEQMAGAIDSLLEPPPVSAFTLTGDLSYKFARGKWDWFVDWYGDKINTIDITKGEKMFEYSELKSIPFVLNGANNVDATSMFESAKLNLTDEVLSGLQGRIYKMEKGFYYADTIEEIPSITFNNSKSDSVGQLFGYARKLKKVGDLVNLKPTKMSSMFNNCSNLRELPKLVNFDPSALTSNGQMFDACYSLRSIPDCYKVATSAAAGYSSFPGTYGFRSCYALDEVTDIPINPNAPWTSNGFTMTTDYLYRLKRFTFALNDGQPYVAPWKNQELKFTSYTGYCQPTSKTGLLSYNSGITADKEVNDDATYQALKDDPDWFATKVEYSRFNHDSAVELINSLPDTTAYLAANGGVNKVMFDGKSGSATDGGAINTLTAAEVKVATDKGWTIYVDNAVFTGV